MPNKGNEEIRRSRRRLLLIVAVFAAPILVAMGWYALAPRLAPAAPAHGQLIEPARPLEPFAVERAGADPYTRADLRGHWTMVVTLDGRCGERCRDRLYATRQIHDALGEDRIRVRRVAIAPNGAETGGLREVLRQHPRLTVLAQRGHGEFARQLPDAPTGTVFLIDPFGNLMMRFGPEATADGILNDLERLLKVSRIG